MVDQEPKGNQREIGKEGQTVDPKTQIDRQEKADTFQQLSEMQIKVDIPTVPGS